MSCSKYVLRKALESDIPKKILGRKDKIGFETPEALWFSATRPPEELYDTMQDPHEVNNLVGQLVFDEALVRLREALDQWLEASGDMGVTMTEEEMVDEAGQVGRRPPEAPGHRQNEEQGQSADEAVQPEGDEQDGEGREQAEAAALGQPLPGELEPAQGSNVPHPRGCSARRRDAARSRFDPAAEVLPARLSGWR